MYLHIKDEHSNKENIGNFANEGIHKEDQLLIKSAKSNNEGLKGELKSCIYCNVKMKTNYIVFIV